MDLVGEGFRVAERRSHLHVPRPFFRVLLWLDQVQVPPEETAEGTSS